MANKGQKFNKYSVKFKKKILFEYSNGLGGECSLAKKYNIPRETIRNWIRKLEKGVDVSNDGRGKHGRPKTRGLTLEDYKERYEILKKYQAFLQARREKK